MKWTDVEDLAEELENNHPEFDIMGVRFTQLKKMVLELEGFDDNPDKCNERILEAIQANWLELRNEQQDFS